MAASNSSRALAFVFLTLLLDSIGFGIIVPVMPDLVMTVGNVDVSTAARYGGLLLFVYALMQFFFSPIMGNLSDRFGRRPLLLLSLCAFALDYVLMGWAPTLVWLFIGRIIAGIAGSTFGIANAFIADISPPEKRAQNFGLLGAAFGLGFVIGPVIGGLLGSFGPRVPFYAAAVLSLLNLFYGLFVLPESLATEDRRSFEWRRANPFGAFKALRSYPALGGLLVAMFLLYLGHQVLPSAWSYYTKEKFAWSERDIGYSLGFVGILMVVVQGYLTRVVIPKTGERTTALVGMVCGAVGYLGYAFATQGWMLYIALVPGALAGFTTPSLQGLMTRAVPKNAQGELQGALGSLNSVASILGPLVMTQLFASFTHDAAFWYFPGAPFVLAAILTVVSMVVFGFSQKRVVKEAGFVPT